MPLTRSQLAKRLESLGYFLTKNATDNFKRKHNWRTSPNGERTGGGPTNYFDTLQQVEKYLHQVEQVREWQNEAA